MSLCVQESIYSSTKPSHEATTDVLSDTISQCALCHMSKNVAITTALSLDGQAEEYTVGLVFHDSQSYHASCANFWRHLVSKDIPVLE